MLLFIVQLSTLYENQKKKPDKDEETASYNGINQPSKKGVVYGKLLSVETMLDAADQHMISKDSINL